MPWQQIGDEFLRKSKQVDTRSITDGHLQKRLSNDRAAMASAIQTIISVSNTHSEQQHAAVGHVYFCKSEQVEDDYLSFCSSISALGERKDLMKRTQFLKEQYSNII